MLTQKKKQCPGCGIVFSYDNIKDMINDQVESEFGASWDCWENCFYCGTPLIEEMTYEEWKQHKFDSKCIQIKESKINQIKNRREALKQEKIKANEEYYIQQYGYKCPNCGKYGGQKISTTSRVIGLATLGVLSSNVGKTYKCKHCGYKW